MEAERWNRIEKLCYEAMMLPAEERPAFVARAAGGDDELRREIESLLAADARAGTFLSRPLPGKDWRSGPRQAPAPQAGNRAGNYRLLRKIGDGGMSTVFLAARADDEFHKEVAVKILRRELAASNEYLARFRVERQILASLEHPLIARLLDGGTTEQGFPFVAMELVEGEPIDVYCDRRQLDVHHRLALFRQVCAAVQHAHQHLVVHRDLKPSNILVTADGVPKLLDFGIAKLLDPDPLVPGLEPTADWRRLFTPSYASPEQVRGERITTASDVYSLGVVLFKLLTGHLPRGFTEGSQVAVTGEEVERPSVVLGRVGRTAEGGTTAEDRDLRTPSRVPSVRPEQVRGDLDNIVVKALARAPERRYSSAEKLADDLRRHQEGLPVSAREATVLYRLGKYVRRHRLQVATAAAFLVLIGGFALTLALQAGRTVRERDKAERTLEFLEGVLLEASPQEGGGGPEMPLGEVLERGVSSLGDLDGQPEIQSRLLHLLGNLYTDLGSYEQAEALLRDALAKRRSLGSAVAVVETSNTLALALLHRGRYDEAEELYEQALELGERDLGEHVLVARSLAGLGMTAELREDLDASERWHRQALELKLQLLGPDHVEVAESLERLGVTLGAAGLYQDAEELLRRAIATYRSHFGDQHPRWAVTLGQLGTLLVEKRDYERAKPVLEEASRLKEALLGPEHPSLLVTLETLAVVEAKTGNPGEAVAIHREILAAYQAILGDEHPNVARSYHNLAAALLEVGELGEAEQLARRGLGLARRSLGDRHPHLAHHLSGLARGLLKAGKLQEAEVLLRQALSLRQAGLPPGHWLTAQSQSLLGTCLVQVGRFEEGETLLTEGWKRLLALRGEDDEETRAARERLTTFKTQRGATVPPAADPA